MHFKEAIYNNLHQQVVEYSVHQTYCFYLTAGMSWVWAISQTQLKYMHFKEQSLELRNCCTVLKKNNCHTDLMHVCVLKNFNHNP